MHSRNEIDQVTMATEYLRVCVDASVFGVWPLDKGYQLGLMNQIEFVSAIYAYQSRLEEKIKIQSTY